jgi:hypothetical protein
MTMFGIEISYLSGVYILGSAIVLYVASCFFIWTILTAAGWADEDMGCK